jgi:hypothetical protein
VAAIDPRTSRLVIGGTAALGAAVLAVAGFAPTGCGGPGGPSDFDRMVEIQKGAADTLATSGAKLKEKQYPPFGSGWAVDMRGLAVPDNLLRQLKQVGNIVELDLSKTNVTDDHLRVMHEIDLHALLGRLDLSGTAVTDAALDHLDGCLFLTQLNLTGTKVTPAAVERFKKKRMTDPRAKIKTTTVKM